MSLIWIGKCTCVCISSGPSLKQCKTFECLHVCMSAMPSVSSTGRDGISIEVLSFVGGLTEGHCVSSRTGRCLVTEWTDACLTLSQDVLQQSLSLWQQDHKLNCYRNSD